jgi:diguanylate cyclase (GGDEF)-like protein
VSKALIADDDRVWCKVLGSLLTKWGYQTETVFNGDDALRELMNPDGPQLAILDWMMPGLDGVEVIKRLRAAHRKSYTYVLLLTSREHSADLVEGLEAGADDYLRKPFDALEDAEYKATHDFLSGIYNRAAITGLLKREASRCKRSGEPMSVMMVDIDHFKSINDTYGHPAGDEVIKQVTVRISSVLRTYDAVGRFGGEEFLVLTPNCALNEALAVAERLRSCVADDKATVGELAIPVSVSVGVSAVREDILDVNVAVDTADLALYAAKKGGRNRVEYYVPESAPPTSPPEHSAAMAQAQGQSGK